MTAPGSGASATDTGGAKGEPRTSRPTRSFVVGTIGVAILLTTAACGTSGASSTTTPTTLTPAAAASKYLNQSGTGDKTLAAISLPSKWTVTWTFNCQNPATTGTFALSLSAHGIPSASVTSQTGLGGGGHRPYTEAATYTFVVKTTCGWRVTVGGTPTAPVKAVATTTTAPKKPTTTTTAKSTTASTT